MNPLETRYCAVCSKEIVRRRNKWSNNRRTACCHSCAGKLGAGTEKNNRSQSERFWNKVDIRDENDCWIWTGGTVKQYGEFRFNDKIQSTHRISWQIHFGTIPEGMDVLHHCDNPPCVNPKHLFLGTHSDNMQDAEQKGRKYCRGKGLVKDVYNAM